MEKLWKIIDGNKTIIFTFLMFVLQLEEVENWMNPVMWEILTYVFGGSALASGIHHIKKGKLKTDQN